MLAKTLSKFDFHLGFFIDFAGFHRLDTLEGTVVTETIYTDNSLNTCFGLCESTANVGLAVILNDRCICMEVLMTNIQNDNLLLL